MIYGPNEGFLCYLFVCDECDTELDTGETDFYDAKETAKRDGLLIREIEDQWHHFCSYQCYRKYTGN